MQDLCVKVPKRSIMEAGTEFGKKKVAMFDNEVDALARASAASVPGVVQLVACPHWHGGNALVLKYHGK